MTGMRVPFAEAITEPLLLKKRFKELSTPQQVILKALYGVPLETEDELRAWAILQGSCDYDELGYPTNVKLIDYIPKEYNQLWAVLGRRSGKTDMLLGTMFAYEACLGGHTDYVRPGQECLLYNIAHRLDVAKLNMRFIRAAFDSSPLLSKEVVSDTSEMIRLKNGISLVPSPASLKAQRGLAIPVVGLDEVGFWYSDPDAANPDIEVERSVSYSQLQFPNWKRIGISTPWSKEGLLWRYYRAGTEGSRLPATEEKDEYEGILVCFAPTASIENPRITRKALKKLQRQDPEAFDRESLCKFPDSISGFLSSTLLMEAVEPGAHERSPLPRPGHPEDPKPHYVAAMDPAFRYDSFAFCVVHRDLQRGVVVDAVRRWTPVKGEKLNPKAVLSEIKPLLATYDINVVYSDQYQLESLQQIAMDMGLSIEGVDFTSRSKVKIFGNLQQLVNQRKLALLDPSKNDAAKVQLQELTQLERRILGGGNIAISAPEGKHDDMAAVLALAAYKAVWLLPEIKQQEEPEPTPFQLIQAQLARKRTSPDKGLGMFENWD